MSKTFFAGVLVCACVSIPTVAAAHGGSSHEIVEIGMDHPSPGLRRTALTVQVGSSEDNRFGVVRIRQTGLSHLGDPPIILIAPFGFPAEFWELGESGAYGDAFAPQLALADYDVWLIGNRAIDAQPGQCESGEVDCSVMSGWDQDSAIEDALFIRGLVRFLHPLRRPVIGGLSGGSSTALATVDRAPHAFAGLFLWEGTLYTPDPDIRARNAIFCNQDEALLDAGTVFDPAVQGFATLLTLAQTAPDAPSPIPVFPPGTTNLQALVLAFSQPDPSNPLNFTEGFVRLVAEPFADGFAFSGVGHVLGLSSLVGNYAPVAFLRDTHCSIAGEETRFVDDLDRYRGHLLVYAEGLGFGQMMLDTAALMPNATQTIDSQPELGESDRFFHGDWESLALEPLLTWLGQVY